MVWLHTYFLDLYISILSKICGGVQLLSAYLLEASADHAKQVLYVHSYISELLYEQHIFEPATSFLINVLFVFFIAVEPVGVALSDSKFEEDTDYSEYSDGIWK